MKKIILYEYDMKSRSCLWKRLEEADYAFLSVMAMNDPDKMFSDVTEQSKGIVFDLTSLFREEERGQSFVLIIEGIIEKIQDEWPILFIIDKRYTYILNDFLFYRINKVESLEALLGFELSECRDIVSLEENEFLNLVEALKEGLVGNEKFKKRLEEELRKYRVFNKLGYQPIFSVLICGQSGIGKTEVARILTKVLSPNEPFIKINFGNYSDQNALSSLIGSPRGYVGSTKGELSEKLNNSRSKVVLIDEFEKCDKRVQNFFLQLLEDGMFTDSLGRDYNLDKYIIVFTANLSQEKIGQYISPELRSRFNLKYSFSLLNDEEKKRYVEKRTMQMLKDIKEKLDVDIVDDEKNQIMELEVTKYSNMRDINGELMNRISKIIYTKIYK